MAIYEDQKLILVHIMKTGGTALDRLIKSSMGLQDEKPDESISRRAWDRFKIKLGFPIIGKHSTAADYKKYLGERYSQYQSFAIVRNPWDWLVSWYVFVRKTNVSPDHGREWRHALYPIVKDMSFESFVEWVTLEDGLSQLPARKNSVYKNKAPVLQRDWLSDVSGNIIVDQVGRFENLRDDAEKILGPLGFDVRKLRVVNSSNRGGYQEYYSKRTRVLVENYFQEDIDMFGYHF